MTARAMGPVLAGSSRTTRPRSFQPVRRESRHAGEREHRIWGPLGASKPEADRFRWAMMQAAKFYNRQGKRPGKHNGHLGGIGIEVLEYLLYSADWKTGALEPAIAYICERIRRSRAAVVEALARLKEHGFLDWIRRTEPTDNVGAGPQVRQISNAYGFSLAALAAKAPSAATWIKRVLGIGRPPPDCEDGRRNQAREDAERMFNSLSCEDLARARVDDPDLAELLARLGRHLDLSASSKGGQTKGMEK
jgi:hypothetical protein